MLKNWDSAPLMPQHQNPVFFKPMPHPGNVDSYTGWIGGHPYLPGNFKWPHNKGEPFEFLCQLSLAAIPKNVWNGLGPREGWLSFFLSYSGRLKICAIYSKILGTERSNVSGWRLEHSNFDGLSDENKGFINPPVAWPLSQQPSSQSESEIVEQQERLDESKLSIIDPELQPLDWQQLKLLIVNVRLSAQRQIKSHQKAIDAADLRKRQPMKPEILAIAKEINDRELNGLIYLENKYSAYASTQPFSITTWANDADVMSYLLGRNNGTGGFLSKYGLEESLYGGLKKSVIEAFGADSEVYHEVDSFLKKRESTVQEIFVNDLDISKCKEMIDWLKFKTENLEIWNDYYQKLTDLRHWQIKFVTLHIHKFIDPNLRCKPSICQEIFLGETPKNWGMLLNNIQHKKNRAIGRRNVLHGQEIPEVTHSRKMLPLLKQYETSLEQVYHNVEIQSQQIPFDRIQWQDLLQNIISWASSLSLSTGEYRTIRSKLTAENFNLIFPTLDPTILEYFEKKWIIDAESATLQLGGVPRGWGHEYVENVTNNVMLIQIPSNSLTGFSFGDVSDLIISISKADLKNGNFNRLKLDVSN